MKEIIEELDILIMNGINEVYLPWDKYKGLLNELDIYRFKELCKDYIIEDVKEILDCKELNITDISINDRVFVNNYLSIVKKEDISYYPDEGYILCINISYVSNLFIKRLDREYKLNQLGILD